MTMRQVAGSLLTVGALACWAPLAGCDGSGGGARICDAAELTSALASATPGTTVPVGAGTITGAFTVPPGVTLAGPVDAPHTHIVGPAGGGAVLTLMSDAANAAAVSDLEIESHGSVGVLATGAGAPTLGNVTVTATLGVGVRLERTGAARIVGCTVTGPVTPENAGAVPVNPTADETATHGILVVESHGVWMANTTVRGFARFGVLAVGSDLSWQSMSGRAGSVGASLGTGVMISGGTAMLDGVQVTGMLEGVQAIPAYGIVIAGGADVTTHGVVLERGEGFGLLQDSSTSTHSGLTAMGNRFAGLWTQRSPSFVVLGDVETLISGNGLAGIVSVETDALEVHGARVDGTTEQVSTVGETGLRMAADGVHLMEGTGTALLDGVTLDGNARVGLLVDVRADADLPRVTLTSVTVSASGSALGAVAQSPTGVIVSGAWDASVIRQGAAALNDAAITTRLDVLGAVGPMYLPIVVGP